MKTLYLSLLALSIGFSASAQNKQVQKESKTTVTTVKDSEGEKKLVRTTTSQEVQNLEFENADSNALNKDLKATPTQVTATTTITTPDGSTRLVDVDRSAYYTFGNRQYQVSVDRTGYTLSQDNKPVGVLRNLSTNSYIYKTKDKTSVGYFDENGNLVLQTYDDKTDKITTEIFERK